MIKWVGTVIPSLDIVAAIQDTIDVSQRWSVGRRRRGGLVPTTMIRGSIGRRWRSLSADGWSATCIAALVYEIVLRFPLSLFEGMWDCIAIDAFGRSRSELDVQAG